MKNIHITARGLLALADIAERDGRFDEAEALREKARKQKAEARDAHEIPPRMRPGEEPRPTPPHLRDTRLSYVYLELLKRLTFRGDRAALQHVLAYLRDEIAAQDGRSPEEVQSDYEAQSLVGD